MSQESLEDFGVRALADPRDRVREYLAQLREISSPRLRRRLLMLIETLDPDAQRLMP